MNTSFRNYLLIVTCLLFLGCGKDKTASASASGPASQQAASQQPSIGQVQPVGPELRVDPARAWQYTKEIIALGPRWDGSKGQERMGAYLHSKLKSDDVEEDRFVASTPAGKIAMRNIIAKFPGTKDGIIVLGSHIDTNYPLRNTNFIGANDGACTTALLLAIADQLRGHRLEGYSVWLAFFDGEEAIEQWSDTDSLYGSKHLAAKWQQDGTIKKIKALFLADMIGDANLDIARDANSTPWLQELLLQSAQVLGYQSHFFSYSEPIEDDHLPFQRLAVPVVDVIDLNYGYDNSFHHTTDDTLDKLSPKSLQIAGDVILETMRRVNALGDHPPDSGNKKAKMVH